MSDVTLLRTMALKSVLGYGQNAGERVGDVLKYGQNGIEYIAFLYFRYSKISFNEEILDLLEITKEFRIEKPGSNTSLFYKWRKATEDDDAWMHRYNSRIKYQKLH